MIKKLSASLFILSMSLFSVSSFAVTGVCSNSACDDVKITRIYPSGNTIYIATAGIEANLTNCSSTNGYIRLLKTHSNFEELYPLLLAAQFSGKPIYVRTRDNGVTEPCDVQYLFLNTP